MIHVCDGVTPGRVELEADPTGIRPLLDCTVGDDCASASSWTGLLGWMRERGASIQLDPTALSDLITFGTPLGRRTLIRGVQRLHPGERLAHRAGGFTIRAARPLVVPDLDPADEQAWVDAYVGALRGVVARALVPGARLGCTLSGGLDSRTLAALLAQLGAAPLAITFGQPGMPDVAGARSVAKQLGLEHLVSPLPEHGPLPYLDEVADVTGGCGSLAHVPGLPSHAEVAGRVDRLVSGASGDALLGEPSGDVGGERWLRHLLSPLRETRRRALLPAASPVNQRLEEARLEGPAHEDPTRRWLRHALRWRQATVIADGVRLRLEHTDVLTPYLEHGVRELALALPAPLRRGRRLQHLALYKLDPALAALPLVPPAHPPLMWRTARYLQGRTDHLLRHLWLRGTPERGVAFDIHTALRRQPAWRRAMSRLCEAPPPTVDPAALRRLWRRHLGGRDNHGVLLGRLLVVRRFVDRWVVD